MALVYTQMCAFLDRGTAMGIPQTVVCAVIVVTLLGSRVRRKSPPSLQRDRADMCGLTRLGCTCTKPLGAMPLGLSQRSSRLVC